MRGGKIKIGLIVYSQSNRALCPSRIVQGHLRLGVDSPCDGETERESRGSSPYSQRNGYPGCASGILAKAGTTTL